MTIPSEIDLIGVRSFKTISTPKCLFEKLKPSEINPFAGLIKSMDISFFSDSIILKRSSISTIFLIFTTAIVGVYYAKYEGLNTLKSGFLQIKNNEPPTYEVLSGAAIAFAAFLLIIPGFATDVFGFLLIFPYSRRFIFENFLKKFKNKNEASKDFIDGEFEDIEEKDDRKI